MSRIFGPVRQIGYAVDDLDRAIDRWLALGIGPFYRLYGMRNKSFRFNGKDVPLNIDVAVANSGDMQIELIYQHDDAPTPYRQFLDRHGPGMHHLSVWSENYDQDIDRLQANGFKILSHGENVIDDASSGFRFAYFDGFEPDTMMEIADFSPMAEGCRIIREAAADWDGSDPIRRF